MLFILAAFMSTGSLQEDEHFQLLEFANFKLGNVPVDDLPWEYSEKMRPAFQVAIVYGICHTMEAIGIFDPFHVATILRIFAAILSFVSLYLFFNKYKAELIKKSTVLWFAGLTFFLWYIPCISVRFSSECFGTIFLLFAIAFYHVSGHKKSKSSHHFLAGLFLGLSFICRYQMGFMIIGLGMWVLFIKKENIKVIGLMAIGFLLSLGIGLVFDYWFYGKWVLSFYNYFYQNLVENKAAGFGTSPFWFYAQYTPLLVFPLFGIVIVPCIIAFFIKYPRHLFTWILIPFILIHHIIGHKEMRFLFPITPFIPFIVIIILEKVSQLKYIRFLKYPFLVLNILALIIMSFKPANDSIGLFKYLYRKGNNKPVYFIDPQSPFRMYLPEIAEVPFRKGVDISIHFYYRDGFYPHALKDITELDSVLSITHQKSLLIARTIRYREEYERALTKAGIKHQVVYNTYHSYFSAFNYYDWMSVDVIGVWTIIELEK